ncbi:MAG: segregation/condensation protein A [Alphaproteobacteria bacterium]|nr:segregation/condensation protein A [Alphaproteobacteria bacterium]
MSGELEFQPDPPRGGAGDGALVVSLEAFEGPLDLLLTLAREQKVDLARISMVQLADQYLAYVAAAKRVSLDIAADYLVMAAWLAYLKSRLLLPPEETPSEEPSAAELAERLNLRLRLLEAMRDAGRRLMALPRLGRGVFVRGMPEGVRVITRSIFQLGYYDLLKSYAGYRERLDAHAPIHMEPIARFSVEDALHRLSDLLGADALPDWTTLETFLPTDLASAPLYRNALATTLVASLELVRTGRIAIQQPQPFGPIYLKRKPPESATE